MEDLYNKLVTTGVGLALLGMGYGLWFLSGVINSLFNTKTWSWKKTIFDLSKVLIAAVVVMGLVALAEGFEHYTTLLGADTSWLTEPVSITSMLGGICGGIAYYWSKALTNLGKFLKLKWDSSKVGENPDYAGVASGTTQFLNEVVASFYISDEAVEAHNEWELTGGKGMTYVVNISSYDAFKNATNGKGYDIDGYYGPQCLTAGHLVTMIDGSYVAVEDLQEGDVVLGGNTVVSNTRHPAEVMKIRTQLSSFTCTLDHKCVLANGSIKLAKDLELGDTIATNLIEPEKEYDLTDDELRWLGFWLGDGTKKCRWKNTTKPECFVTVGTPLKEEYLQALNINQGSSIHSNGKAKIFRLVNREHPELLRALVEMPGRALPCKFTKAQYALILEGYLHADGSVRGSGYVATSVNKELLVSLQYGAMLNGWRAILGEPRHRENTNLCDNPLDIYRLTINKNYTPIAKVQKIEFLEEEQDVYVLNLGGDHLYLADNLVHHNCWDGCALLWQQLGQNLLTGGDNARGCWTRMRDANANPYFTLIYDLAEVKRGDVCVFGLDPYGHIGFADEDYNGSNTLRLYGQNQGGTPGPDGLGGAFNTITMNTGTFLGAFRFTRWLPTTPQEQVDELFEATMDATPEQLEEIATKAVKPGDTVYAWGVGTASSNGTGAKTKNFPRTKMKVIMVNDGKNGYALNQYNRGIVGNANAVTAWWPLDRIDLA